MNVAPFRMLTPLTIARAVPAAAFLAVALGLAGPILAENASADPVVAIVNGTPIHESDLAVASDMVGRNIPTKDPVERRDAVLNMAIDATLLGQIATERKIADEPDLQRRMTFARNQGLAGHLLETVGQQAITDEAVRKAYDDLVVKNPEPEFRIRQILFLVKDTKNETAKAAEEKAQSALKRLGKGEDFAAVFANMSDDASLANGGDLGWRGRAELGKELAETAGSMKVGEVSQLIRTAAGFHIIKLEDRRDRKPPTFEQARAGLARMVAQRAQFTLIQQARETAKIERVDQASGSDNAPHSN